MDQLSQCRGFQWDEGNSEKNRIAHKVSRGEAEQVFFKHPLAVRESEKRSDQEPRYYALGQTDMGRRLFVVFTIRDNLVRVISARDVSRRGRRVYEHAKSEATEADPEV